MSRDERIAAALTDWRTRREAGEALDPAAVIAAHPDIASDLRAHFAAVQLLDFAVVEQLEQSEATEPSLSGDLLGTRVGPYRIERLLGRGGMGRVYLADQLEPIRRQVALKILDGRVDDEKGRARFEVEREALSLMDHPYIAAVYDAGVTAEGTPYVSMAYVEGETITAHCVEHKLGIEARLEILAKVCEGVHHAHQKGVIHRDIKPSNVLVVGANGHATPRVIDFGLAKSVGAGLGAPTQLTVDDQILGTPAYMSPEQAGGRGDVDVRTDVYALGVLLYEVLTDDVPWGRTTFTRQNLAVALKRILEKEPPKPSTHVSTVRRRATSDGAHDPTPTPFPDRALRGDLDWIVMRALAKDRDRRYASAQDLADDVRRHLRNEPVEAGPPTAGYRLGKFVRRHKAGVIGGVLTVLSLLVGLVVSLKLYADAEDARQIAEASRASEAKAAIGARTARDEAEQIAEFLVFDVSQEVMRVGNTQLLKLVSDRALDYFASRTLEERDLNVLTRHVAALHGLSGAQFSLGQREESSRAMKELIRVAEPHLAERPAMLWEVFNAYRRLVDDRRQAGDHEEGQRLLSTAESLFRKHRRAIKPTWVAHQIQSQLHMLAAFLAARTNGATSVDHARRAAASMKRGVEESKGDATARHTFVITKLDQGQLEEGAGQFQAAVASYEEALAVATELLDPSPDGVASQALISKISFRLADMLYRLGRFERALPHVRRSLEVAKQVALVRPDNRDDLLTRMGAHYSHARILSALGQSEPAIDASRESLRAAQALLEAGEPSFETRARANGTTFHHALVLIENGRPAEAQTVLEPVVESYIQLAKEEPEDEPLRRELGAALDTLSHCHLAHGRFAEAESFAGRALAVLLPIPMGREKDQQWAANTAKAYLNQGRVLWATGRPKEALASFRQGRSLLTSFTKPILMVRLLLPSLTDLVQRAGLLAGAREPTSPSDFGVLAYGAIRADPQQAVVLFERALVDEEYRNDIVSGHLYNAACSASLASLRAEKPEDRQGFKDKALAWLREDLRMRQEVVARIEADGDSEAVAKAKASHRAFIEHALKSDPDLKAVRDQSTFKAIYLDE